MTRMLFRRVCGGFAVFLTVMTLVTGARAAVMVQDLGILNPGDSGSFLRFMSSGPIFADGEVIKFRVDNEPVTIDAVGVAINIPPFFNIENFVLKLVRGDGPPEDIFNSTFLTVLDTAIPFGGALTLNFAGVLQEEVNYGLLFSGNVGGAFGFGLYAGSFSISAVPLPPAVWLFLSALVGLVGVVRRRHKQLVRADAAGAALAS